MSATSADDAVVGAGILGLAHAYHLARRGRRVVVFERSARAEGASVRNFGMIWPIGQPSGARRELALRSREHWLEVLSASGLWHERAGSLHLAYREDEARVLREFAADPGSAVELWTPAEVRSSSPVVREKGLLAGLYSGTETCVDPRQVVAGLPAWLASEYGVRFEFGRAVTGFEAPCLEAGGTRFEVERLFVCAGSELATLFPEVLGGLGLVPCKLQMLRSRPVVDRIGPMLAGGLTLRHYESFAGCPGLPALRERVARESPDFDRFGIHVMASQNGNGELVLGDSHEYGDAITPFDREEIDALILSYLDGFLDVPALRIASRWHGIYVKHPSRPWLVERPRPGVTLVTGVGGAGMTLSFGLAEQVVEEAPAS